MKWERAQKDTLEGKRGKKRGCLIALVVVVAIAIIGGISQCGGGEKDERLEWPTSGLAVMLPAPNSDKGSVVIDNAETFDASVDEWGKADYDDYVAQCVEKGFTVDAEDGGDSYEAYTEDGYHLSLNFYDGLEQMSVRLEAPVEMGPISWPTAGVGALLPAPSSTTGQIAVDSSSQFTAYVGETDANAYASYVESCMGAGFTVDYDRGDTYFNASDASGNTLHLEHQGFDTMYISLYAADSLEGSDEAPAQNSVPEEAPAAEPETEPEPETGGNAPAGSDFRAMVDEWEAFMNKYCDFMETYNSDSGNVVSMALDYADMMSQYSDWAEKMDAVDDSTLSAEDVQYYVDAQTRINARLLEIGQ